DARSPVDVCRPLLEMARRNDIEVILKLHPKEQMDRETRLGRPGKLTLARLQALMPRELLQHPNVIVDSENSFDTYALMDRADLIVTINSQAGLEAAVRGKQVLCGNGAFYGDLGFTHDYASIPQLQDLLD